MKKSLSIVLAVAFAFAAVLGISAPKEASAAASYIRIGSGNYVYHSTSSRINYTASDATYDASTNTLTLTNLTTSDTITVSGIENLTINLVGENSANALTARNSNLTWTGTGSIALSSLNAASTSCELVSGTINAATCSTSGKGSTGTTDSNPETFDPVALYAVLFAIPVVLLANRYARSRR